MFIISLTLSFIIYITSKNTMSTFAAFVMVESDLYGRITALPRNMDFINNPKILAVTSNTPISA
ncbi:hypothetical protein L323_14295 [Ruminiclostridium papyrosolvens C7]|uniref:Uncharacterized protein n=1 Tax=Ruminiclostridium papyrosolvens C7 TaxID=1330534 RepID=U4R0L5_9FIRM|nr:hypothetical protein L323_14295 [Ruminiclostridium papyrosolvens C7]